MFSKQKAWNRLKNIDSTHKKRSSSSSLVRKGSQTVLYEQEKTTGNLVIPIRTISAEYIVPARSFLSGEVPVTQRHVSFKAQVSVILIPHVVELVEAGLKGDLWWSRLEIEQFKVLRNDSIPMLCPPPRPPLDFDIKKRIGRAAVDISPQPRISRTRSDLQRKHFRSNTSASVTNAILCGDLFSSIKQPTLMPSMVC